MAKPTDQVRGLFRDERGELVTSVRVRRVGGEVTLLHDYPPDEFAPEPGWTVEGRGFALRIKAVAGRQLTCEPLEVY
jgi:hypothetical protein